MFYVKEENSEVEVKVDITDDNVHTSCPVCGKEFQVDIVELIQNDKEFDLYGTSLYCPECGKKALNR